ncbi:BREX system P-loop protein BrxC, partial [Leptospira selangorensis]
ALDKNVTIDGTPFLNHLQDRLRKNKTKTRLQVLSKKIDAAVVMLDLASEQLAGATQEEVSTVLYYKVLQFAGYSRNLKVAALERKLKKDSRFQEFLDLFKSEALVDWSAAKNDMLVIDSLIPGLAHRLYPNIFKTPSAFNTETSEVIQFENDRVAEMLQIAREASEKKFIIFIIDEVGQYVGSRQNLIQNLDGLAKNIKNIGNGKVWIIGTAQQTLTEDHPKAALNSPELFKLNDRFPIKIDLEAEDIKEICISRLLSKSSSGETELGALFDKHGQKLRHNTKLEDAGSYGADFNRKQFIDLYPFLPAHFDILLRLLGLLAKSTGGIGLRSAIKVIQDILIEEMDGKKPVADQEVGWIANTVTLYDTLEKDIRRAAQTLHHAVGKVKIRFPNSHIHQDIAKTVCILQILSNLPITAVNISGLLHSSITEDSQLDSVKKAIDEMIQDPHIPFGVKEGQVGFHSEKLNDIEVERSNIPLRTIEIRKIWNEALLEVYSDLPMVTLNDSYVVRSGLKTQGSGGFSVAIAGDRNPIQTLVELVNSNDYDTAKIRVIEESRQRNAEAQIFLIGRQDPEIERIITEIYRNREIANKYRNDPSDEVREYCRGQNHRSDVLLKELERVMKKCLSQGSFVFRGDVTSVETLHQDLLIASKNFLSNVAKQVFDRNIEAPVRVETDLAERFLRLENLSGMTAKLDPLGLVQTTGGKQSIDVNHKAIVSVRDMIDKRGAMDGKTLTELFSNSPFGWSPDTLRYILSAMLLAGEIKLKSAGREVSVNGQHAIEALKNNNSFKPVGISLRDERISHEVLALSSERLTELSGESILPLEAEISKATMKLFPRWQHIYGPLLEKLKTLRLTGVERLESLSQDIKDILDNDASDAAKRIGIPESQLYWNLKWASEVKRAFDDGLEKTLHEFQIHKKEIDSLPNIATPAELKERISEDLAPILDKLQSQNFYQYGADFSTALTQVQARVREVVLKMAIEQKSTIKSGEEELYRIPEWKELTGKEKDNLLSDLERLAIEVSPDLVGLRALINQDYIIQSKLQELKTSIQKTGQSRLQEKLKVEFEEAKRIGQKKIQRQIFSPQTITTISEMDDLIQNLVGVRSELEHAGEFELVLKIRETEG